MKFLNWKKLLMLLVVCMVTTAIVVPMTVREAEAADTLLPLDGVSGVTNVDDGDGNFDHYEITGAVTLNLADGTGYYAKEPIVIKANGSLTINGEGVRIRKRQDNYTDGEPLILVEGSGKLTITGTGSDENSAVMLYGSRTANQGKSPAIKCAGTLTLTNVIITNWLNDSDSANTSGAAIATTREPGAVKMTLTNCTIYNCQAEYGSALYIQETDGTSNITLNSCLIYDCVTTDSGTIRTRINAEDVLLTLTSCIMRNNQAASAGGDIYWATQGAQSKLSITDSQFLSSKTTDSSTSGGSLYLSSNGTVEITGTTGTATAQQTSRTTPNPNITGTLFYNCSSTARGGAIDLRWADTVDSERNMKISGNVSFDQNSADHGGALSLWLEQDATKNMTVSIDGATFTKNKTINDGTGGGILADNDSGNGATISLTMKNTTIDRCTAGSNGGGIRLSKVDCTNHKKLYQRNKCRRHTYRQRQHLYHERRHHFGLRGRNRWELRRWRRRLRSQQHLYHERWHHIQLQRP